MCVYVYIRVYRGRRARLFVNEGPNDSLPLMRLIALRYIYVYVYTYTLSALGSSYSSSPSRSIFAHNVASRAKQINFAERAGKAPRIVCVCVCV